MTNLALVCYRNLPSMDVQDDLMYLVEVLVDMSEDLNICYTDIVEDRGDKTITELVEEMLATDPDVLHIGQYRTGTDEEYIDEVLRRCPELPIVMTSAHEEAAKFCKERGIFYVSVPFEPGEYAAFIKGVADGSIKIQKQI